MLRVQGGELRGRRLRTPAGIRPTQGLVVQAIFNIVRAEVAGAFVVDLFAGSGALGIEALSRGAAEAVLVERSPQAAAVARENVEALHLGSRARVVRAEAAIWVERHPDQVARAAVVLMDPPYRDPAFADTLRALDAAMSPGSVLVAEHAKGQAVPAAERLEVVSERRYGETALAIMSAR